MNLDHLSPPVRLTEGVAKGSSSIGDMFERRVAASPHRRAWRAKQAGGWRESTWREVRDQAAAVASWLCARGLELGDTVLVVGSTRSQWYLCDLGGQLGGLVTVGAYPTLSVEQLGYVIEHSDAKVVFAEGAKEVAAVREVAARCPKLQCIVVWEPDGIEPGHAPGHEPGYEVVPFSEVLKAAVDEDELRRRREAIEPDHVAIVVYTSGTTGPPKGAMLTQANLLAFLSGGVGVEFDEDDENLSFLPMAHVAERIAGFYMRVNVGISTALASSVPAVLEEIKEVRPTLFGAVPRIFEKAYDRIQAQVDQAPPMRQKVFRWAEGVGLAVVDRWQRGEPVRLSLRLQYRLADRLVFSKIREVFGGRVRMFVTGAAPIPSQVLRFFWALGFPVFEAYGQTEATVITHVNRPGSTRLGSVGRALSFIEHRLADDGEVLVRGPLVFRGYHKNDDATREAIDDDGWLHTGDIGRIDDDGYLYIVDRKKHIIITAGGKNITPANIENEVKAQDPIISQVHAHGDRRPYVSAMVTLSPTDALDWAQGKGMIGADEVTRMKAELLANPLSRPEGLDELLAEVGRRPEIRDRVLAAVRRANAKLSQVEKVKRVMVLERELSIEEDEITPTLKVKRKNIEKGFAERFDRLYAEDGYGLTVEGKG
ncbi:AMP-dependent synthetase/ligase [Paraliomyxa miuraensis]|uniref:AMP-dependent synthetase/ligase n=1 Tax=Paraliomyxa miuraensis TaxID=376150 RepID=UPI00224E9AC7|nr:long-chain fatty acid--CoA ligase [Paraliomyxa miuraensis]MCX4246064.1 long-chain fatty acid--CoA ligase [Paraliomyxa miuraensis]